MKASNIKNVEPLLTKLIHNAIVGSVHSVVDKCNKLGNNPQEPDFIASLTLNFTPQLFQILKLLFNKNRFSVTGIYCHQKPLVNIGMVKSPEIGDLLLVYIYTDDKGFKRFNSLLFQAKISKQSETTIAKTDEHQLKLYSEWPRFTYERAGKLNGTPRDILPKTINDGGQYLLIDNDPLYGLSGLEGTYPMGCAIPAKTLNINNELSEEIVDFLIFKSGRTFEQDPNTTMDDWTKMIWDLLDITKAKASKRMNSGINSFPRQITEKFDGCCFITSDTTPLFSSLYNKLRHDGPGSNENFSDEENSSPSVIIIESSERNEE